MLISSTVATMRMHLISHPTGTGVFAGVGYLPLAVLARSTISK
jgi:hypothetical protein